MEENELRIGNFISDVHASENGHWQVTQLREKLCFYGGLFSSYDNLKPIPITERWLKWLGFEEGSVGYYYKDEVIVTVEGQVYFGETETWITETHFVHQLQNLFFALTKEELNKVQ